MKFLLSGSSGSKQTKFLLTGNKEGKKNVEGCDLFLSESAERFGEG
jgi:hypothetical protein